MATTQIDVPEGLPYVDITREINAPRDLVHRAYTDPELLRQWLGPRNLTMTVEKWDVHDGGAWRYVQTEANGTQWGFHGVFHGPQTPDQMIQTFEFDGVPGHVSFSELRLEEKDGKTVAKTHVVFMSVEDRDGMVGSGMATGINEGYERLDELVARLVPTPA
ncbi:MAG: SRPBCC family protein [Candidatus Limnocylindria bacterium]